MASLGIPRGIDYSRFDKIGEEDEPAKPSPAAVAEAAEKKKHCANCRTDGARKSCSKCQKVVYCNRECQVSDWPYHKRICTPPKKEEAAKPSSGPSTAPAAAAPSTATPAATPAASTAASTSSAAASAGSSADMDESYDEEDKAALQSVSKGYRYFARTLDEKETTLIGDIKPKKLEELGGEAASAGAGAGASAPVSASVVAASSTPVLLPSEAATPSLTSASVWNKAGTFEERDLSSWFKTRITDSVVNPATSVDIGVGDLVVTAVNDWEGSASVMILRGKPRKIYDVKFKVEVEFRMRSGESGAGPAAPEPLGSDGKPAKAKGNGLAKALLVFHEVSNDCDDEFASEFQWGNPAAKDTYQDIVRSSVSGAVRTNVLAALQTVINEFMTM